MADSRLLSGWSTDFSGLVEALLGLIEGLIERFEYKAQSPRKLRRFYWHGLG